MKLGDYGSALALDTAFWIQGFDDPQCSLQEAGKLSRQLERNFRTLAILALLANADTNLYCHHLIRSGMIRMSYLRRARAAPSEPAYYAGSGRFQALHDLIASGSFRLARELVDLSPSEWQQGYEYEDDYCYAQLLSALITGASRTDAEPMLQRYADWLGRDPRARLDLCAALLDRDQEAFDSAIEELLALRELGLAEREAKGGLETPHFVADKAVYVEAVALLRLAEAVGLGTQREYRYAPSIARAGASVPFPGLYGSAF